MPGAVVRRGDRVTLRTVERDDIPFIQRGVANPGLRVPLGNPTVKNQEQVEERFEDANSTGFLVCLEDSEALGASDDASGRSPRAEDASPDQPDGDEVTPIGSVSVTDVPWSRTEIGYWIVPEYQGEGYGTEAVTLLLDYTFRTSETASVGAMAYDFNDASRGLLKSLGFTQEGRRRKARFVNGEYRDAIDYGLLREEWLEREEA